jgi:hypothetical protein
MCVSFIGYCLEKTVSPLHLVLPLALSAARALSLSAALALSAALSAALSGLATGLTVFAARASASVSCHFILGTAIFIWPLGGKK